MSLIVRLAAAGVLCATSVAGQGTRATPAAANLSAESVMTRARESRQPFIDTMKDLVAIESGSRDIDGLNRLADLVAARLRALGGEVELVAPEPEVRFEDTPDRIGKSVVARFRGAGAKRILLLAHMDTVYEAGMGAQQPFRIDGDRAYGLGIADDKQGVALILHALALLRDSGFRDYGLITVVINGDEEISSPSSRSLITRLGAEHDVVFSCEGSGADDALRLATSGNGAVMLRVKGRASHAGSAPDQGRNALYELSHQILQMRDLSDPSVGVRFNWTVASAGTVRNMIPAAAEATADVRVQRMTDWDAIEAQVRKRVTETLVPETQVSVVVERRRPPLEPTEASRDLAEHAKSVYREAGRMLRIVEEGSGGATDAAIAARSAKGPVIEGFGLIGYGGHSNDAEYVDLRSLEPRLYLLVRMIADVSRGLP